MSLVFEKLTQTLAEGESLRLNIAGDFFRIGVAPYPVAVSLVKNLRIIGTMQNMLAGDYVRDIEFDAVIIDNGATAQTVAVQIAGGGAGSDRVLGEVSVINGEVAKVRAGVAFFGVAGVGGVAGNYSQVQLLNPAGSGKTVILNKLAAAVSAANSPLGIYEYSVPLTAVGAGRSKKVGGPVSVGLVKTANSASLLGTKLAQFNIPTASDSREFGFSEPIILGEGLGVMVQVINVAVGLDVTYQWTEEPV